MTNPAPHPFPDWIKNDLGWLASAPGLLDQTPVILDHFRQTCRDLIGGTVSLETSHVQALNDKRNGALGRYFELLVQTVIALNPAVSNHHANVLVHDGNRTRGELDFVYEIDGAWTHLELAVKYYLGVGDLSDPHQWHGPAARDTLGRKYARLMDHQLQLPKTSAGQDALNKLDIKRIRSEALMMGMLFHPYAEWQTKVMTAPDMIADNHPKGWWIKAANAARILAEPGLRLRPLTKPEWLSPQQNGSPDLQHGESLLNEITENGLNGPIMVLAVEDTGEQHRGFIVPDDWPPLTC